MHREGLMESAEVNSTEEQQLLTLHWAESQTCKFRRLTAPLIKLVLWSWI